MKRALTLDDIESLAVGAWILGTGGGGNPYLPLLNMRLLYKGKVIDVARRITEGYLRGAARFHGVDDWKGSNFTLDFQNEWIVAWRDGEPIAMTPDLICVLDSVSGEAVGSETIRYGQRVTVIALPPPAIFLTPKGLEHVGPRAFGYDLDFKSVFS